MTPEAALAEVPILASCDVTIAAVPGGLSNRTYRIDTQSDSFFLRLDDQHTGLFGLDRVTEQAVLETAAARGLAPEVVYSNPRRGILLTRLIEGETWRVQDLDLPARSAALAALLQRVHALPPCGVSFDALAAVRRYCKNLRVDRGLDVMARRCEAIIAAIGPPPVRCCCHNDVVVGNVIGSPEPRLLDWEYACDNDPLFDLASLIAYHDLPDAAAAMLLEAYAGERAGEYRERLQTQIRLFDALQWLWLANRQYISPDNKLAARLGELQQRIF